ncbi:MarR family transcriptional regulator [Cupriavidus oxalaticus]|uniref:MarR family winged helix-turn-helix transcriptional regulator n=1 Tax=Cupriavidus oxalaticus TaxID=96344 RepID=UPI003F73EDBA
MRGPLKLKTDYINILLDQAAERTRERGSRVYEAKFGISLRDIRLLRMIGITPGITMGQLVQQSAIEKTLASKLVGALVKQALVQREICADDARQVRLSLTDEGVDLVRRAEPLGIELESRFLYCLTPAEIEALRATLLKLIDAESASRDAFEASLARLQKQAARSE